MNLDLSPGQIAVVQAFSDFGAVDDAGLAVYVHHVADVEMSSSGVRSRRAELVRKGLVTIVGTKRMKSGKLAAIHNLNAAGRRAAKRLNKIKAVV